MAANVNVRPEDKPKVIAIVVGIVFVNIFVFSRLISGSQPASAEPSKTTDAPSQTPTPASATPNATTSAKSSASPVAGADIKVWNKDESQPVPIAEDPFRPVVTASTEATPAPKTPTEPATHSTEKASVPVKVKFNYHSKQGSRVANNNVGILPPINMNLQTRPVKQEEPLPEFEIKGVIVDDNPMVILRMGERSLYKSVGERMQGGIVIERVTQEAVTFRIGRERRVLAPGQTFKPTEVLPTYPTTNE